MLSIWSSPKFCRVGMGYPIPYMPISGSSNSAANKDMML